MPSLGVNQGSHVSRAMAVSFLPNEKPSIYEAHVGRQSTELTGVLRDIAHYWVGTIYCVPGKSRVFFCQKGALFLCLYTVCCGWKMLTFLYQHDCVDAGPMGTRLCLLVCIVALLACEASALQTTKVVLQQSICRTVYCMHVASLGTPWMSACVRCFSREVSAL